MNGLFTPEDLWAAHCGTPVATCDCCHESFVMHGGFWGHLSATWGEDADHLDVATKCDRCVTQAS